MNPYLPILACPNCHGKLERADEHFTCLYCNQKYPIVNNIPCLIPSSMEGLIRKAAENWDNITYDYDQDLERTSIKRLKAIDQPLVDNVKGLVLEIGCGTGRLSEPVENQGCEYIGLDPSLNMLRKARRKNIQYLICGVGEYLPLKDNTVDSIIGGYHSFRYLMLEKALRECNRVLKSGGRLLFTLYNYWPLYLSQDLRKLIRFQFNFEYKQDEYNCNDVYWIFQEKRLIEENGFIIKKILSTNHKIPGVKYFKTIWGAFLGEDIIFICDKKPD